MARRSPIPLAMRVSRASSFSLKKAPRGCSFSSSPNRMVSGSVLGMRGYGFGCAFFLAIWVLLESKEARDGPLRFCRYVLDVWPKITGTHSLIPSEPDAELRDHIG